jgi:hypothetical protein
VWIARESLWGANATKQSSFLFAPWMLRSARSDGASLIVPRALSLRTRCNRIGGLRPSHLWGGWHMVRTGRMGNRMDREDR